MPAPTPVSLILGKRGNTNKMSNPNALPPSESPAFWEHFYQSGELPWDIGEPAPPFVEMLTVQKEHPIDSGRMAVLGSGAGHDAAFFGKNGFEVIGFDYAPSAIERSTQQYGQWAQFVQADIFNIPKEYWGTFDFVLEHTCFSALHPRVREQYVQTVHQLLKPSGKLLGLFWAFKAEGGPPFKTDALELSALFSPAFMFDCMFTPDSSVERRKGEELLCLMHRNNNHVF